MNSFGSAFSPSRASAQTLQTGESSFNSTKVDIDREYIVGAGVNNNLVFYIDSALV